ncbi:MAG: c-type cytochrome [Roseibacillus sp.]|nr:c-type cytochrome [Roseibacillus sp.]
MERVGAIREVVAKSAGSPYRGRPIFKQRCASCHILFHSGGKIRPDLTDDLETMLSSIVDPGIREGYEGFSVKTNDDRFLTGFLTDRGANTISLRGFDGSVLSLPRAQIAEMTPLGRSLMPEGLLDDLSDGELRDLFAYLRISQPLLKD